MQGVPCLRPCRSTAWTIFRCRCGKTFLVQLLNIASLGPIFGAVLQARLTVPWRFSGSRSAGFSWGAVHDFYRRYDLPAQQRCEPSETVGTYLGNGVKQLMRVFSVGLMVARGRGVPSRSPLR